MTVRMIAFALTMALLTFSLGFGQSGLQTAEAFQAKLVVADGNDWQSSNVTLKFEADRVVLSAPKNEFVTESIRYSEIKDLEYSHTTSHRKIKPAVALVANVFALPLLMQKVEGHWLTVESEGKKTVLNLDKDNYRSVVAAFEANSGRRIAGWNVAAAATGR